MSITPSWPEQYERLYAGLWADVCRPPVTWSRLVTEARDLARNVAEVSGRPDGARPSEDALLVLEAIAADFDPGTTDHLSIGDAFDPRYSAVFNTLPTGRKLEKALTAFGRSLWEKDGGEAIPGDAAEGIGVIEMPRQHGVLQWAHYGRRVYMLGRHTAELLARTDLPRMPVGELHFPLPAFYVRLPAGMYRLQNSGNDFPVDGVLVTVDRTDPDPAVEREVRLVLCPDAVKYPGTPTPLSFLRVPPYRRIDALAADIQRDLLGYGDTTNFWLDNTLDPIPNLVFGFALYLMSEHPLLESVAPPPGVDLSAVRNPGKRRKREQRAARESRIGYVRVGHDEAPRSPEIEVPRGAAGRVLDRLVWVRGHWRRQAHGPGHELRRLTWIEPHTRGPDVAEQLGARAARVQDARPAPADGFGRDAEGSRRNRADLHYDCD